MDSVGGADATIVPAAAYQSEFDVLSVCVLLPTYNNAGALDDVIASVLQYTTSIIVVNDGSTDGTAQILAQWPELQIISYSPNCGKGIALRKGLKAAAGACFRYAISMDTDGQHYASDLPQFLEEIQKTPDALLVGARDMNSENVPGKSSFGNRFSNFWYWVTTGLRLPDTQSGYRLYPVKQLAHKRFFTTKYEFEIEVLVRAAWSGIPVRAIPVKVYYPPAGERISHFRPAKDFARISVLNTVLVLIAVLWIKPREFLRLLSSRNGLQKLWQRIFQHPEESNLRKASSVAFGVFMGIVPLWGFQLLIGIPAAIALRLNKALFLLSANISVFPLTAFWLAASLTVGKLLTGKNDWRMHPGSISVARLYDEGFAFFAGGTVLALVMAVAAFTLTFVCLHIFRKPRAARV